VRLLDPSEVYALPTLSKAQLTEAEPPTIEILDRMSQGVTANARPTLHSLRYYTRRNLSFPDPETALTEEEELELVPIVNTLIEAAIISVHTKDGVLVASRKKSSEKSVPVFGRSVARRS
jgi:hypothetical protein